MFVLLEKQFQRSLLLVGQKEEIVHAEDEVYIPPQTTAQIFWLKNRQPKKWRDKQEIDNSHDGTVRIVYGDMKGVREEEPERMG